MPPVRWTHEPDNWILTREANPEEIASRLALHDRYNQAREESERQTEEFTLFNMINEVPKPAFNRHKAIKGSIEKLRQAALEHDGIPEVIRELDILKRRLIAVYIFRGNIHTVDFEIIRIAVDHRGAHGRFGI